MKSNDDLLIYRPYCYIGLVFQDSAGSPILLLPPLPHPFSHHFTLPYGVRAVSQRDTAEGREDPTQIRGSGRLEVRAPVVSLNFWLLQSIHHPTGVGFFPTTNDERSEEWMSGRMYRLQQPKVKTYFPSHLPLPYSLWSYVRGRSPLPIAE
jgi:hypothetical protein